MKLETRMEMVDFERMPLLPIALPVFNQNHFLMCIIHLDNNNIVWYKLEQGSHLVPYTPRSFMTVCYIYYLISLLYMYFFLNMGIM